MSETLAEQTRDTDTDLLRFAPAAEQPFELRDNGEASMPTLAGHFAVFDAWTEISSVFEGNFLERIAPGAFTKTFAENRPNMRVLFQHGRDPQIGEKILGPVTELREDDHGAYFESALFDTSYNRDLLPALRSNEYGSSFRFKVMREEFNQRPDLSEHNPDGLPERSIVEAKVMEFGPVTFPAYAGATAGLRSATDWWIEQNVLSFVEKLNDRAAAPPEQDAPEPVPVRRSTRPARDWINPSQEVPQWRL